MAVNSSLFPDVVATMQGCHSTAQHKRPAQAQRRRSTLPKQPTCVLPVLREVLQEVVDDGHRDDVTHAVAAGEALEGDAHHAGAQQDGAWWESRAVDNREQLWRKAMASNRRCRNAHVQRAATCVALLTQPPYQLIALRKPAEATRHSYRFPPLPPHKASHPH